VISVVLNKPALRHEAPCCLVDMHRMRVRVAGLSETLVHINQTARRDASLYCPPLSCVWNYVDIVDWDVIVVFMLYLPELVRCAVRRCKTHTHTHTHKQYSYQSEP